jgi:hypothetical protein
MAREMMQAAPESSVVDMCVVAVQDGFKGPRPACPPSLVRVLLQLFTIGLYKLEPDGRPRRDAKGAKIATYDNDNVMSFARVWTGFDQQPMRSNIEKSHYGNWIDPMQIKAAWKDANPKPGLDGTYIGDYRPLCGDLPPRNFLQRGAIYQKLGAASGLPTRFEAPGEGPWLQPSNSSSQLYPQLCDADGRGACQFPYEVVLGAPLACHGVECEVGALPEPQPEPWP